MKSDFSSLLTQYRAELLDRTIPFWLKYGIDWQNGGVCTCIADDGKVLSGDKYAWSQLRAVWTFSALYNKIERKQEYLDVATHIFNFIKHYGHNSKGEWYFCLDQNGKPLFDSATSIYCDGFAIYGFTEFARATGNQEAIDLARQAYANVMQRLAHQCDVALRQVTNTAVYQVGRPGRGSLGEVMRVHQDHAEPSGRRIQRHPQACSPTANHRQVIVVGLGQTRQKVGTPCGKGSRGSSHGMIVHGRSKK